MPYETRDWDRPSCSRCGGALLHGSDRCVCGGRSAWFPEPQERDGSALVESRGMTWEDAMAQLWERYVGP